MNRSTFTQSGELVTISRLKNKEKWKFLRSLRFRITVILVIIGIVPCVILEKSIVNSYEDRAVSVRSITVKNQCDIICNQLIQQNYMEDPGSDVINGQLSMLTNIYGGRILIIDQDFRVIKDTYDMDRGKTIISQEVIQSFQGKETSQYDRKNNYLEMTVRIQNTETKETLGVMLVSISADEIRAIDRVRKKYCTYYTNTSFGSMEQYDIALNSSRIGVDACVRAVLALAKEDN